MRQTVAVGAGKLTRQLSRWSGRGGSTLPGRVVLALEPDFLRRMAAQVGTGSLLVTGTNGKTTTANLLAGMLRRGHRVCHNAAGANLLVGLTTAFLTECDPWGRLRAELAVLEVDEATMPRAAAELSPVGGVVTNFFRDQLDRYGELQHSVELVRRGLAHFRPGGFLALNADDPLVAGLAQGTDLRAVYFGVDDASLGTSRREHAAEARTCRCGQPLGYRRYFYAHLGHWACSECGLARPEPAISLRRLRPRAEGARLTVATPRGELEFTFPLPGLYNVYNVLGALAAAWAMGEDVATLGRDLSEYSTVFGRMERLRVRGREVRLALVKNPVGFNQVLRTLGQERGEQALVLAINDRYADGTDVSWLWDVDFEPLAGASSRIVASGLRAADMALRLKYAGVPPQRVSVVERPITALERALAGTGVGGVVWVLPTYTALLELRADMARRGWARRFWRV
ncbi:MAG: MurT ligase domain-containing protein [Thermaerobacter sp.]|nr:MurT ligase domain-containing protein [Thermaerobacter sp.]